MSFTHTSYMYICFTTGSTQPTATSQEQPPVPAVSTAPSQKQSTPDSPQPPVPVVYTPVPVVSTPVPVVSTPVPVVSTPTATSHQQSTDRTPGSQLKNKYCYNYRWDTCSYECETPRTTGKRNSCHAWETIQAIERDAFA